MPSNGLDENKAMRHLPVAGMTARIADEFERLII